MSEFSFRMKWFFSFFFFSVLLSFAQEKSPVVSPNVVKTPVGFELTKPLRDNPIVSDMRLQDYEFTFNNHENRVLDPTITPPNFRELPADPQVQHKAGWVTGNSRATLKNFAGQNSGSYPPDTNGAVNSNYYFQVVNTTYAIYNKSNGALVAGPSNLNSIFNSSLPGANCNSGDPIVLWDEHANKWLYAEFSLCNSNKYMLIAVSQTADPTGSWWSWSFDVDDTPDYMKFGIWQDGYYMATNTSGGNDVYVFERSVMINGGSNPKMIGFDNPNRPSTFDGFHCILPLDNDGPWAPSGAPGQFITVADDGQSNPSDALYIYELNADWNTPSNSTFSRTQTLNVNSFSGNFTGNWNNIPQKGTSQKLDGVSTVLMYRAQYRNFSGTQRLVVAHTIAESSSEAALRWYELEKTGSNWYIRQQSTYNPDNLSRWNMSIAMNGSKEIGIGFSVSNSTTYPGIRYIGQSSTANAAANNTLDMAETVIWDGAHSQSSYNRWGDYSNISVDPSDDKTFWFTSEYMGSSTHGTRIASFQFSTPVTQVPVADFSANDLTSNVGQTISFTDSSTNNPTSWSWSFSPNTVTYVGGTSSGSQNPQVTFDATGSYSVTLTASNSAGSDSEVKNNYISVTQAGITYCSSQGNTVTDEYIQRVQLNTIDNASGATSGYSDYTSISTNLVKGQSYTVTVTPKWTGTIYNEAYAVWIDYNHDGDFTDSGELVWSKAASKDTPNSGNFSVPNNATETATRMRVSMKYNGIPTSCETFQYGEVEDYTVNITAAAADTTPPVITLNGSATVNLNVGDTYTEQGATATDNVDGDISADIVIGGDSVNTNVAGTYIVTYNVSDAAGNAATEVTRTVHVNEVSGGCTNGISSYPYHEGFENTIGAWTQATNDDFNWTTRSGSTPSSNTGPSGASEGSYYVYMESSSPHYSYKRAILISPCFDLSNNTSATLTFKYHMYGSSKMGSLALEASTDNGSTWSSIWSKSGNQGNSWKTATIDLGNYTGGTVKLRFNGITGTTWQGDMAVDAFNIASGSSGGDCVATTLTLVFDNYPEESSWDIKDGNGSVVFSGGTYGSQPDGSTLVIPICIDPGCYTFTMKDSYGDGMCCSYGNGSYSYKKDSDGSVLASGGSFTSSDATNFCVGSGYAPHFAKNETQLIDITLYPIPVKNELHVVLKDQNMKHYSITNLMGQEVLNGSLTADAIDVSRLQMGVYVLNCYSDKKMISKKFVKQ